MTLAIGAVQMALAIPCILAASADETGLTLLVPQRVGLKPPPSSRENRAGRGGDYAPRLEAFWQILLHRG